MSSPGSNRLPWVQRSPGWLRFFFELLLATVFCLGAVAFFSSYIGKALIEHVTNTTIVQSSPEQGLEFSPSTMVNSELFRDRQRLNILILGIDYNYNEKGILYTKGARSDTIMVLSLAQNGQVLNLVNIPRDTSVEIAPHIGYDKINSAYAYGGLEQAVETVSSFLNVPIQKHVIIKVKAAHEIIDAIGGVDLDVEKDMDYDDNWGNFHVHLKQGFQHLDGDQVVGYARFRMDEEGDRGRIRRQQQVIEALTAKLKDPSIITKLPTIAKVVENNIETDLSTEEMLDLARLYSAFQINNMHTGTIIGDDAVDPNGISYIVPYGPENERTVNKLLLPSKATQKGDVRIQILCQAQQSQSAWAYRDYLYQQGFDNVWVQMSEVTDLEESYAETRFHHKAIQRWFSPLLGSEKIKRIRSRNLPEYEVTIYLGNDITLEFIESLLDEGVARAPEPSYPSSPPPATHYEPVVTEPVVTEPVVTEPVDSIATPTPSTPQEHPSITPMDSAESHHQEPLVQELTPPLTPATPPPPAVTTEPEHLEEPIQSELESIPMHPSPPPAPPRKVELTLPQEDDSSPQEILLGD